MTADASRPQQAAGALDPSRPPRRRPSGTPPPLPHHIQRSGFIWLGVAVVALGAAVAIFAGGLTRRAIEITVIDDAVTRRIVQAPVPGLTGIAQVIAEAGAAPAIVLAAYALLLALIVLRRFRHFLVLLLSYEVLILLAEAQSVPAASRVTCIRALPVGWTLGRVQAQRGRSVITLDNVLAGSGSLRLTLAARCDAGQAMPERSPGPGIARFRAPGPGAGISATWFDVFPGGCVTIALRPATNVAAVDRGLPRQIRVIVGYVSRARLQHELALRSGGRLRLDPSP